MSQSTFDDDELFAEATEEMRADIEGALSRVDEQLPAEDDLLNADEETLPAVLDSLEKELNIEPIEDALTEAQKAFLLGKRADAFDEEYVTETEATITHVGEVIETLKEIETVTADLIDALSSFEDLSSESTESAQITDTDSEGKSESQSDPTADNGEDTAETANGSGKGATEQDDGEDATTPEGEQADLTDSTDG